MRSTTARSTTGALLTTGLLALPMVLPVRPATAQARYTLTGIARDFSAGHPDFDVMPSGGFGHYAGNVGATLGPDRRPVFTGAGARVTGEALDSAGNPIAPHLANSFSLPPNSSCYTIPDLAADGQVRINNQSRVDSFDSRLGPYGGGNVGAAGSIGTNSTGASMLANENSSDILGHALVGPGGDPAVVYSTHPTSTLRGDLDSLSRSIPDPVVPMPAGMPPSTGDYLCNGPVLVTSDLHVDGFELRSPGRMLIDGDRTIYVDSDFEMNTKGGSDFGTLELTPGSTLTLYVLGDIRIIGHVNFQGGDPTRCRIYKLGAGAITIDSNVSRVVARIVAPDGALVARQGAEVFGTFRGDSIDLDNNAKFHIDVANSVNFAQAPDTPGMLGAASTGGVDSADSFKQWFRDVPGVNQSTTYPITLEQDVKGFYEYATPDFSPVNDRLLGNEGASRNAFFTYVIEASFTYEVCAGQMIEFEGHDDAWVFVGDALAIDLGGVSPGTPQQVELDRLGLTDGQTYTFRLFYAQRQSTVADFRLRTNLVLSNSARPFVITSAAD
jgi:fibro-slime domain-containing protein